MGDSAACYRFGPFLLDSVRRVLLRDGEPVALTSKCFETLLALVEQRGSIADKEQLLDRIWPDTTVEEKNLTINISQLRKILGEGRGENRYIVTVPGRGYRFVAPVDEVAAETGGAPVTPVPPAISLPALLSFTAAPDPDEVPPEPLPFPHAGPAIRPRLWIAASATAVLLIALVIALMVWRSGALTDTATLAVLPFRILGPDQGREYLGAGLADALITRLGGLRRIVVAPLAVSLHHTNSDPIAAGRALRVQSVLEGTVHNAGDRIRVTVRLLATDTGASRFSASFDERFTDILSVEDSISEQVASALATHLSREERGVLVRRETRSPEAHQFYMRGAYLRGAVFTEEGKRRTVESFEKAIEHDPEYALAHAWLADVLTLGANYYWDPQPTLARAARAAERAMSIDSSLADAHAAKAWVALAKDFDWKGAERSARRALALNPAASMASDGLGYLLMLQGRTEDAVAEFTRAQRLSPVEMGLAVDFGMSGYFARQYARAIDAQKDTLLRDPNFFPSLIELGRTYDAAGQPEQAIPLLERAFAQSPCPWLTACLARAHIHAGRTDAGRALLARLLKPAPGVYVSPLWPALVYEALDQKSAALDWLEKAWAIRAPFLIHLKVDPVFDRLRGEPRFQSILEHAGLAGGSGR